MDIREAIKQLSQNGDEIYLKIGTASDINPARRTCKVSPIDGTAPFLNVKLQAGESGANGFVAWPKPGSYVVVGFFNPDNGCVLLTHDTESIEATVGENSLLLNAEGVTLNGGKLGGLVNISELKANLESLKTYCDALKNAISAGLTAVGTGLEANGEKASAAFNTAIAASKITLQEMEDTKVKH